MFTSKPKKLTDLARVFLEPTNATHRQYEALRAFFVERLPGAKVVRRFGYAPGSLRVLIHQFRHSPRRDFFLTPPKGPQAAPKSEPLRDWIVALRKQNLSIYDISPPWPIKGTPSHPSPLLTSSRKKGFRGLPRRAYGERRPPRAHHR